MVMPPRMISPRRSKPIPNSRMSRRQAGCGTNRRTVIEFLRPASGNKYFRGRRADNSADNRSAWRAAFLQDRQHIVQRTRTDTKQKPAARLRIGQEEFLSRRGAVPGGDFIGGFQILTAAAGDAVFGDQPVNLFVKDRHSGRVNFRTHATGAAKRAQMTEQTVAGHVRATTHQSALGQVGAYDIESAHTGDGFAD